MKLQINGIFNALLIACAMILPLLGHTTGIENSIVDQRVQSVTLTKNGSDDRYPIMNIDVGESLRLSFDMMGSTNENLQYTILHCDVNWNLTSLNQSEYIRGMMFDNISDYRFCTNTFVKYVHYNVALPNDNMKPMIAGNYIIKVYRNFDESDVLMVRRMMVIKNSTSIEALARPASLAEYRFSKQEVQFSVTVNPQQVVNPFQDVNVVILQNYRWDNAVFGLKPMFVNNNKLEYNYLDKALFNGGNEFRYFDIRQLRQFSANVRSKRTDSVWHCMLNMDESRGASQYFQYIDYDGKRILANKEGNNSDIDGDYAYMTFFLSAAMGVPAEAEIYVLGEFTDWRALPGYKMYFNRIRQRYELEVPLKQGRYEYVYAIKNENGEPDETLLEGNHFQTENEYLILVYTKNLQYHYDELIGMRRFNSTTP